MADCIQAEFGKVSGGVWRVQLSLNSPGGSIAEVERTVETLRKIRKTHQLNTVVSHGHICGSACVPVFLAGKYRYAAFASLWIFHEVQRASGDSSFTVDRSLSDRFFREYFVQAGVSETWLKKVFTAIPHAAYWQTGQNLWDDKSGIITHPLDNIVPQNTERPKY